MLAVAFYLICVGHLACTDTSDQNCSVVLGDGVQLAPGDAGSHVLATPEGVAPLWHLDAALVARIDAELRRFGGVMLDPDYVKKWNEGCAARPAPVVS
jgi:hypothetical protein